MGYNKPSSSLVWKRELKANHACAGIKKNRRVDRIEKIGLLPIDEMLIVNFSKINN